MLTQPTPKFKTADPVPVQTTRCLITAEPDDHGRTHLTVYGPKHLLPHVCVLPVTTVQDQKTVEQLIETLVPRAYRDLYWPGGSMVRATACIEPRTATDVQRIADEIRVLNAVGSPGRYGDMRSLISQIVRG